MPATPLPSSSSDLIKAYRELHHQLATRIKGQDDTLHYILASYFTSHHVLLEDYPGTGKTTLAKTLATLLQGTEFKRVQFTPDLLPSDLTGVNIFDPAERNFRFHKGPLFCDILLADEINRASPRTQSALLEAMAENQITIEGHTYLLSEHFFVIATQNPVDFRGTFPLPEAQMDRFGMQCSLGYLHNSEEKKLIEDYLGTGGQPSSTPSTPFLSNLYTGIEAEIRKIHLSDNLKDYAVSLISSTRSHPDVQLPLSPRATLTLVSLSQALAFFRGKDYVTAAILQEIAPYVLSHRLLLTAPSQNTTSGKRQFVQRLLEQTTVPG